MLYTIKNTHLSLTVDSCGAQMISVKNEAGEEMLWQANKSVWGYSAPMLFPWAGRIKENRFFAHGQEFTAKPHGIIRDFEHSLVLKEDNLIIFEYKASEESKSRFPFNFVFRTSYVLSGHSVHHKVDVTNTDSCDFGFDLGFHPGFCLPFDDKHTIEDYCIEFDTPQSPKQLLLSENNLLSGESRIYGENVKQIPMDNAFPAEDTLIFSDLTAKTVSVVEKDSGKRIDFDVQDFPFVSIWRDKTSFAKFLCIEPWMGLPDREDSSLQWDKKEHGIHLKPGEACHILSRIRITR